MSTKKTRAILERVITLGMENYATIADELLAEDFVNHGAVEDDHGPEVWKMRQEAFMTAFSDLQWTVEVALADGDVGAIRYSVTGTNTGELDGFAPTGKRATISGATFFRVAGGKVVETWAMPDRLGLLQQLGSLPGPSVGSG